MPVLVAYGKFKAIRISLVAPNPAPKKILFGHKRLVPLCKYTARIEARPLGPQPQFREILNRFGGVEYGAKTTPRRNNPLRAYHIG